MAKLISLTFHFKILVKDKDIMDHATGTNLAPNDEKDKDGQSK